MEQLIKRYVQDVTSRLPEKEREEVRRELTANIFDMLPNEPDEEEVRAVLTDLGAPALLAEQYRQTPGYLLSPAVYSDYVRVIKWLVPLAGVALLVLGMIIGGVQAISGDALVNETDFFKSIFKTGISLGVDGAVQALVWTTVGFIIADRAGYNKTSASRKAWNIDDLPELEAEDKGRIPLSDSIVELVFVVACGILGVLFCMGRLPFVYMIKDGGTEIFQLFSPEFLPVCIPAIIVGILLSVAECVVKIKDRRWTGAVCTTVLVSNVASTGIFLWLITRPSIFNTAWLDYIAGQPWGDFDLMRFMGNRVEHPILTGIAIMVVVITAIECISVVYKTWKYRKPGRL